MEYKNSINFSAYQQYVAAHGKEDKYLQIFLRELDKSAYDIGTEDILIYLKNRKSKHTGKPVANDTIINIFNAIIRFMEISRPELTTKLNSIRSNVTSINADITGEQSPEALQLEQIIHIRNTLLNNMTTSPQLIFSFELAYSYDLTLKELGQCNKGTYDVQSNSFIGVRDEPIHINEFLGNLISAHPKVLNIKNAGTYKSSRFRKMSELTGISINYQVIQATQKEWFPKCALCGKKYPPEKDYWMSAVHKDDMQRVSWIICKSHAEVSG